MGGSNVNQIKFLDNKLSVKIKNVALGSVLSKIQEKTGIEFLMDEKEADRYISVSFQALPLEKALKRILKPSNHSIIFAAEGFINKVIIVGRSKMPSGSQVHVTNKSSSSNSDVFTPPSGPMDVTPPPGKDAMIVTPPAKDMKVAAPPTADAMVRIQPTEDMKVTPASKEGSMDVMGSMNEGLES